MKLIIERPIRLISAFVLLVLSVGCTATIPKGIQQPTGTSDVCPKPFDFALRKTPNQYDLVFEGGGAKGTVFVGALQELEARRISGKHFVGTSAAAITATLMAAGYSADQMLAAVNEKTPDKKPRFTTFMDVPTQFDRQDILNSVTYQVFNDVDLPFLSSWFEKKLDNRMFEALMKNEKYRILFSFVERGGAFEGTEFRVWLTEKLNADCRNLGSATLQEFFEKTGSELTVIASDTTSHEMLILNRFTAPDCPVVWAVRMSMSIPLVWQEVHWEKDWGTYNNRDISGHTIVDGGLLSNFPLDLVVSTDKEVREAMRLDVHDGKQLGFLIDETMEVPGADKEPATAKADGTILDKLSDLRTVKRAMNLVDTMTDAHDNAVINAYRDKVCRLPAKGYGTTEFNMSDGRVKLLVEAGRETTRKYLDSLPK